MKWQISVNMILCKHTKHLNEKNGCSHYIFHFWATVCKTAGLTVSHMLSDRCLSSHVCLSCLSVTSVYCGQTVGRIKMKLGKQIGLSAIHIVLDEGPAPPPPKGHTPNFRPMSVLPNGWMD